MKNNKDKQKISNLQDAEKLAIEYGGYKGPDPVQYGDWQHKGKVTDF